jgi:4-hydroxyphenylpyruvate dioxygenase
VCALGLSIDQVPSALKRAQGLQVQRFAQPIGPGEMEIPSIRGVGGSLLYFMQAGSEDRIWDSEFVAIDAPQRDLAGAGLLLVDHIAQTMQYEEMLSWQLFYLSLFEMSQLPAVQIADPLGLVQSQAIESPEGALRFTLNGSVSAQTLSARFLQGYQGAGVQHIALATADILDTAARLKTLGLPVLPITKNYYEDLEARFGLDTRLLDQLAEYNILYDRDAEGEYFQLYSRAFGKRFFFEIVERRGYRAFGAPNAVIRLAAQSRYREDAER